jgi:hypothetical protein
MLRVLRVVLGIFPSRKSIVLGIHTDAKFSAMTPDSQHHTHCAEVWGLHVQFHPGFSFSEQTAEA